MLLVKDRRVAKVWRCSFRRASRPAHRGDKQAKPLALNVFFGPASTLQRFNGSTIHQRHPKELRLDHNQSSPLFEKNK
jgi:hypothetical protein